MPLRIGRLNPIFQIYIAEGAGFYWRNSEELYFATVSKLGLEFYFGNYFVMDLEGSFVWAPDYDELNYFNILMGFRLRVPFRTRVAAEEEGFF